MKILLCHNHYQHAGGEDQVFADESWLLESHGHTLVRYTRHNDDVDAMRGWDVARRTLWNRQSYRELRSLIRRERPDVMHVTNTFPLISPAAYYAAKAEGLPVVQSLHNYRLMCANSLFLRNGKACTDCLGKATMWRAVARKCYRNSRAASAVVAGLSAVHRAAGTYVRQIDRFIALSEFSRQKFIQGGLPAERIVVKPNFVHPDPQPGRGEGRFAVVVGRFSEEKGIDTLLAAWACLSGNRQLKIVGDGPLDGQVRAAANGDPRIDWLGRLPVDEVVELVGRASCLVLPSHCFENCPKTMIEAFAKGTPVVASRLGALAELVDDGRTGIHFTPGDADDLASKLQELLASNTRLAAMRRAARKEYEHCYTPERNYELLMDIYQQAAGGRLPVEQPSRALPMELEVSQADEVLAASP